VSEGRRGPACGRDGGAAAGMGDGGAARARESAMVQSFASARGLCSPSSSLD
jgi:hypothetical protein